MFMGLSISAACPCAMPVLFLPSVEKIYTFAFSFMLVSWPVILRILRAQTVPFLGTYQTRTTPTGLVNVIH